MSIRRIVAFAALVALCASCARQAVNGDFMAMEPKASPLSQAEIQKNIDKYSAIVGKKVAATQQVGYYYKLLGFTYLAKGMYASAIDAFREAQANSSESAGLFYYVGICSTYLAKDETGPEPGWQASRDDALAAAERNFRRALEIEPSYDKALYSLSVLLVFDLGRPQEARPYLTRYIARNPEDLSALFVMGRIELASGDYRGAAALYDRIISGAKDEETRSQAEANKAEAMRLAGGGQ